MKIVLIAPPAAGKGTQAALLSKHYQIPKISMGEMLREEVAKKTEIGLLVKEKIKKGDLVPDEVAFTLLKKRLNKSDTKKGFILDGYPRNMNQVAILEKIISKIDKFVHINIDIKIARIRMEKRRLCPKCHEVFSKKTECSKCNIKLVKRDDDDLITLKNRFKSYQEETKLVIDYYQKKDILYYIDGNQTIEKVFADIKKVLDD